MQKIQHIDCKSKSNKNSCISQTKIRGVDYIVNSKYIDKGNKTINDCILELLLNELNKNK